MQTNAGPLTGQYTQHGGRERGGGKGAEGRLGGRRWQGTGKATGGGGEKGGTPVGPKDRTDKGNSLTEDTPRDAVTNALRLHLHNFAYKTFKINSNLRCLQPDQCRAWQDLYDNDNCGGAKWTRRVPRV